MRTTHERITTRKSKTLQGRQAYELEAPDVHKTASNVWLGAGELFPETAGFTAAIRGQVITTSNYNTHNLKDLNITNDTRRKC
jgi:hypothetical protein